MIFVLLGVLLVVVLVVYFLVDKPPPVQLEGQRCLITGGSSGIGLATAIMMAQKGARVTLLARNTDKLKEAVVAVQEAVRFVNGSVKVGFVAADVGDFDSMKAAVDSAVQEMGGLDLVVHSAGISRPGRFEEVPLKDFENVMHVNYMGSVHMARTAVPYLKEAGGGRLVFVSSLAGMASVQGLTAYSPTKFAVRALAEGLQMELRPFGIYTTVVNPPDVDTPMLAWEKQHKPEECLRISEGSGLFTAEEIATNIVKGIENWSFFVSTGLDGYLTGSLCAGMSPASSVILTLFEVFFGGIMRLVALFYLKKFNGICNEEHAKRLEDTDTLSSSTDDKKRD